ncbi:hypothetical protein [uncultured Sphaerochaeta sp.]|uniref:hypothetical protein n=1 Tax=uncultured Sphaerochaeta sp. TaxID=886478 RepID=UPI0026216A51|nr:hypothetical protein [uncultured Sphaerochaeta sp.]
MEACKMGWKHLIVPLDFWPDLPSLSATLDSWFASLCNPTEKLRSLCSFKAN